MLPRFFAGPDLGRWAVKIAMTLGPVFFATFATFAIFAIFAAAGHHNPDTNPGDEIPPGAARGIAALRR